VQQLLHYCIMSRSPAVRQMSSSTPLVELTQLTPGDGHLACSVLAETQYASRGRNTASSRRPVPTGAASPGLFSRSRTCLTRKE